MIVVADASAATKLFLDESGSHVVRDLWRSPGTWLAPTLILPEVASAIASARRDGRLSTDDADVRWASVVEEIVLRVVDVDLATAAGVLAASRPIRGADAVYVSLALSLGEHTDVVLVSFDQRQRRAALEAGVAIVPGDL